MKKKIYLLSAPVQSGKTTKLLELLSLPNKKIGGFLSPDIGNSRVLINPENAAVVNFQVTDVNMESSIVQIGRFNFRKSAFDEAGLWTIGQINRGLPFVVIDEIGKLELKNKGFHSLIQQMIILHKENQSFLFVVRDYLVEDVISHYQLQDVHMLNLNELTENKFIFSLD